MAPAPIFLTSANPKSFLFTLLLTLYPSPDYFIRPRQQIRRDRHSDLLGRLQVDDQLKFHRLLRLGGNAKRQEQSAQRKRRYFLIIVLLRANGLQATYRSLVWQQQRTYSK